MSAPTLRYVGAPLGSAFEGEGSGIAVLPLLDLCVGRRRACAVPRSGFSEQLPMPVPKHISEGVDRHESIARGLVSNSRHV